MVRGMARVVRVSDELHSLIWEHADRGHRTMGSVIAEAMSVWITRELRIREATAKIDSQIAVEVDREALEMRR